MDRRTATQRRRNAERCEREQQEIERELSSRKSAARLTEVLAFCQAVIARNERHGLSVGC